MSRRSDLESKGIVLSVDMRLQLSITDSKPLPPILPPFPAVQKLALSQLGSFLRNRRMESQFAPDHHERILQILEKYPALATHKFGGRRYDRAFPLFHMCGAKGIDLQTLQTIYELNPNALRESGKHPDDDYFPLHYACETSAATEIIDFILQKYRHAVRIPCQIKGRLPIHYAVTKYNTSSATLELLLNANPNCLNDVRDDNHMTVLDLALMESCDPSQIQCLMEFCTAGRSSLKITPRGDIYMVKPSVLQECLSIVLPHTKSLQWILGDRRFDDPHVQAILESILQQQNNNNNQLLLSSSLDLNITIALESLVWESIILPLVTTTQKEETENTNKIMESLRLALNFPRRGFRGPLQCNRFNTNSNQIWKGIAANVRKLELERFDFLSKENNDRRSTTSPSSLNDNDDDNDDDEEGGGDECSCPFTDLIQSSSSSSSSSNTTTSLRELKLSLVRLVNVGGMEIPWTLQDTWKQSCLTSLAIYNCHMTAQHLQSLLEDQIRYMPALRQLSIVFQSHIDPEFENDQDREEYRQNYDSNLLPTFTDIEGLNLTKEIVAILKQGRLQALEVIGPIVDIEPICSILKTTRRRMVVVPATTTSLSSHATSAAATTTATTPPPPLQKYHIPSSLQTHQQQITFSQLFPENTTLKHVLLPSVTTTYNNNNNNDDENNNEHEEDGDYEDDDDDNNNNNNNNNLALRKQIVYEIALNRCGREKLVTAEMDLSLQDFITLLLEVEERLLVPPVVVSIGGGSHQNHHQEQQQQLEQEDDDDVPIKAYQIHYEFLRRVPGMWSSSSLPPCSTP